MRAREDLGKERRKLAESEAVSQKARRLKIATEAR
jgi:hypothetical protein